MLFHMRACLYTYLEAYSCLELCSSFYLKGIHMFCVLQLLSFPSKPHTSSHRHERKEYYLFIQQATVKPHAPAQCSVWAAPLTIINICLVRVNKLDCGTQRVIKGFACQTGLLLILLQMASTTCLLSCPEQRRWRKQPVFIQSVTSDDVLVGCKSLVLVGGLKWGDELRRKVGGGDP